MFFFPTQVLEYVGLNTRQEVKTRPNRRVMLTDKVQIAGVKVQRTIIHLHSGPSHSSHTEPGAPAGCRTADRASKRIVSRGVSQHGPCSFASPLFKALSCDVFDIHNYRKKCYKLPKFFMIVSRLVNISFREREESYSRVRWSKHTPVKRVLPQRSAQLIVVHLGFTLPGAP